MTTIGMALIYLGGLVDSIALYKFRRVIRAVKRQHYHLTGNQARLLALMEVILYVTGAGYLLVLTRASYRVDAQTFLLFSAVLLAAAILTYMMVCMIRLLEDNIVGKKHDVLKTFINAIEMKDPYTWGHSEHVYNIVKLFCAHLSKRHIRTCSNKLLDAALLHDIGKIGIDDEILSKPGTLAEDEWTVVRKHPSVGKMLLDDTFFSSIGSWVLYHHERMDGRGYMGLAGEAIPIESRIISIADTYSALTTDRAYRKAMAHDEAIKVMKAATGTQLDARLMHFFLELTGEELGKCAVWPRVA